MYAASSDCNVFHALRAIPDPLVLIHPGSRYVNAYWSCCSDAGRANAVNMAGIEAILAHLFQPDAGLFQTTTALPCVPCVPCGPCVPCILLPVTAMTAMHATRVAPTLPPCPHCTNAPKPPAPVLAGRLQLTWFALKRSSRNLFQPDATL